MGDNGHDLDTDIEERIMAAQLEVIADHWDMEIDEAREIIFDIGLRVAEASLRLKDGQPLMIRIGDLPNHPERTLKPKTKKVSFWPYLLFFLGLLGFLGLTALLLLHVY